MLKSDIIERKFIETYDIDDYEIKTDSGWSDISKIGKTIPYEKWILKTENNELECADTHIVFNEDMEEVFVKDLKRNDIVFTENGIEKVISVENTKIKENMYDLELKDKKHRYYTNGILSHNSMWLNNIAVKIADGGKNVLFVTLEMATHKCMKRMGSQRLRIPIDEYDAKSKDDMYMKNKINELKFSSGGGGVFEKEVGKIIVKKYPTSALTISELDNFIHKFEEVKKIKIHAICVDYINIMGLEKGLDFSNMLFLKGKHFAEGLRYIADKHNIAVITATQTDKAVWGASDLNLKDIPESKAIAETSDVVIGIIRNSAMKKDNKYQLKILKLRDGDYGAEQIRFDFNTKFLLMENDQFVGLV
jgi:DnaB-like helicase C terminal domain